MLTLSPLILVIIMVIYGFELTPLFSALMPLAVSERLTNTDMELWQQEFIMLINLPFNITVTMLG